MINNRPKPDVGIVVVQLHETGVFRQTVDYN